MKHLIKWLAVAAITVLGTCCMTAPTLRVSEAPSTGDRLQETVVALVELEQHKGKTYAGAFCAGVWVDNDKILTAGHCVSHVPAEVQLLLDQMNIDINPVADYYKFLVHDDLGDGNIDPLEKPKNEVRTARVVAYSFEDDLALLEVKPSDVPDDHPVARVFRGAQHTGDFLHVVGHAGGTWWTYMPGYVSGDQLVIGPHDIEVHVLQISAPIWGGNSGGGAFTEDGELAGIVSFMKLSTPNIGYCVHRNVILTFLINHGIEKI